MRQTFRCPVLIPVLALLFCIHNFDSYAQETFTLRGTFSNYSGPVYLDWNDRIDTAVVSGRKFQFTGKIPQPTRARILINTPNPLEFNGIILEPGETVIAVDTATAVLMGAAHRVMNIQYKKSGPINKAIVPFENGLMEKIPKVVHASEDVQRNLVITEIRALFRKNPNSPGPLFYIVQTGTYEMLPREMLDSLYNGLPQAYQENYFGQRVKRRLEYYSRLTIGSTVRDFTWLDAAGHTVSISHYKGKYVFIDVWASWCKPCLEELPLLKDIHTQYKADPFAILGLSIDTNPERWLQALEKHQPPGQNVIDPRQFQAEFLTTFRVNSIPFNLLLDPEGKIVAINLHGEELKTTLAQVLKKKS